MKVKEIAMYNLVNKLFVVLCGSIPICAVADVWTDENGYTWTYDKTDYYGNRILDVQPSPFGDFRVSGVLGIEKMNRVDGVFTNTALTSLIFDAPINHISRKAISGCHSLTSLVFLAESVSFAAGASSDFAISDCRNLQSVLFAGPVHETIERSGLILWSDSIKYPEKYATQWEKVLGNLNYGGKWIRYSGEYPDIVETVVRERGYDLVGVNGKTIYDITIPIIDDFVWLGSSRRTNENYYGVLPITNFMTVADAILNYVKIEENLIAVQEKEERNKNFSDQMLLKNKDIAMAKNGVSIMTAMVPVFGSRQFMANTNGFVQIITEIKGGTVAVPSSWAEKYPGFESVFGSDFAAAILKKTGKKDAIGNDLFVWHDYVAGTDPTDVEDEFTATISFIDGKPIITYSPELSEVEKAKRVYTIYGKRRLQESSWSVVDGNAAEYNFFRLTVEMK